MHPVSIKCRDVADFLRMVSVLDKLNEINNDFPLKYRIGSGPKDLAIEGSRWIDVWCESQAKVNHFIELGAEVDAEIIALEKQLKLDPNNPNPPKPAAPKTSKFNGVAPGADFFMAGGGFSTQEDIMKFLDELENKLKRNQRFDLDDTE
jgi:hypothetical protein